MSENALFSMMYSFPRINCKMQQTARNSREFFSTSLLAANMVFAKFLV